MILEDRLAGGELECLSGDVDCDEGAFDEVAGEDSFGQGVFDFLLDQSLEGAGAVDGVVAVGGELVLGRVGEGEGHAAVGEAPAQVADLNLDDLAEVFAGEPVEDDGLVDAVEKLGAEVIAEHRLDRHFHFNVGAAAFGEALDVLAAEVAGHGDDCVAEVDGAAVAVGEAAVVEDLEEDVKDVAVCLFDFVEQDDAVGAAVDRLGETTALFEADVAGGARR